MNYTPSAFRFSTLLAALVFICLSVVGCDSSTKDLIDLATNPPERKQIDTSRMGVNSFFSQSGFGTVSYQYEDIQQVLRLKHVRVLLAWTDNVQASPSASVDFSFFDSIINSAPTGVDLVVVVAHTPTWMTDPANWDNANPRQTWVNRWLEPVVRRYRNHPSISAWEIFNEPDVVSVSSDAVLNLSDPDSYFDLLQRASIVVRALDPKKLLVPAATESINQNFPSHLDYNKRLVELGATGIVDVWNIHYYSKQFERVVGGAGIADFINSIPLPVWVTESGEQGMTQQLPYVETVWPFLREEMPNIDRIYYYRYASTQSPDSSFGLRSRDANFPVSDLYIYLRDR